MRERAFHASPPRTVDILVFSLPWPRMRVRKFRTYKQHTAASFCFRFLVSAALRRIDCSQKNNTQTHQNGDGESLASAPRPRLRRIDRRSTCPSYPEATQTSARSLCWTSISGQGTVGLVCLVTPTSLHSKGRLNQPFLPIPPDFVINVTLLESWFVIYILRFNGVGASTGTPLTPLICLRNACLWKRAHTQLTAQ